MFFTEDRCIMHRSAGVAGIALAAPRTTFRHAPQEGTIMASTIRSPVEWTAEMIGQTVKQVGAMGGSLAGSETARPTVRRIELADLKEVLARGLGDFGAFRTDVIFLCLVYPVVGVVLVQFVSRHDMLPLAFPLISGFALLGPVVGVVLYEMSRRRELGDAVTWADGFGVLRSPSLGAIVALGLVLVALFVSWLIAAYVIYNATLGPEPPASLTAFAREALTTGAGWTMIGLGCGIGFLFAVGALVISVVSFPLLLDRHVGLGTAIETSMRAVVTNPLPMAAWGLIVAAGLAIGSIPALLGLVFVMPVLGHATWHLYRKVVAA
jgi:uncharacterized membrane protein